MNSICMYLESKLIVPEKTKNKFEPKKFIKCFLKRNNDPSKSNSYKELKNWNVDKIRIDEQENWICYDRKGRLLDFGDGQTPVEQMNRHVSLLRDILGPDVPIVKVICFCNLDVLISGKPNLIASQINLVEPDNWLFYIRNYHKSKSDTWMTPDEVSRIAKQLEAHRFHSPEPEAC